MLRKQFYLGHSMPSTFQLGITRELSGLNAAERWKNRGRGTDVQQLEDVVLALPVIAAKNGREARCRL